jgi:hypothetical protein
MYFKRILLHGTERQSYINRDKGELDAAEMKFLRGIMGRNQEI